MNSSRACGKKELIASDAALYNDVSRPQFILRAVQDDDQIQERLNERYLDDDIDDSWNYDWTADEDDCINMREYHFIDCNIDYDEYDSHDEFLANNKRMSMG